MHNEILFEIDNMGIATLIVNRPAARNALTWSAQTRFLECVTAVSQNPTVRALIITGAGERAFVSGGDLKELAHFPNRADAQRLRQTMRQAFDLLTELPIPVIAAVNGDAFGGGCELLTACDLRIAAPSARFCFAQAKNGLTTGWGGTQRLVSLLGQSVAIELLLTARVFEAQEAHRLGFVHRIAAEDVYQAALSWAKQLASLPQNALAATKQLVNTAVNQPDKTKEAEEALFLNLWTQPNHHEAVTAFLEKRPPNFK